MIVRNYLLLFGILSLILSACNKVDSVREKIDFTEEWSFHLGDAENVQNISFDDSDWRTLDLPHDWSIEADFSKDNPATPGGGALPGGIGWYRKEFQVEREDQDKKIFIDFDGVYWNSKVWINGHLLGERPNGYISFRYDLTPHLKFGEKNVIAVRVDNSKQPNSRWYSGSGIYRNVWLVKTNPIHVDHWGTYVTTPAVSENEAEISIRTKLRNTKTEISTVDLLSLIVDAEGKTVGEISETVNLLSDSTIEVSQRVKIPKPNLWSVENPYLYKVVTQVKQDGKLLDDYETPIGLRFFEFDAHKGFFLNGKSLKIKGVCNHHDLGMLGVAVNARAIERQLEILQEMGCNAIRTAHNPPAPELLELCDKMGFLVVDEAFDMWRKRKSPHDYSYHFPEWHERDLTDLILRDRNHPSVIMWSTGNEVLEQWSHIEADTMNLQQANMILNFANTLNKKDLNDETLHVNSLLTLKLSEMVKTLDPTRPVSTGNNETGPNNHLFRSKSLDVIGFNYHEYNWANFHNNFPDQKLIISESTSGLMSRGFYMMPSDSIYTWPEHWDIPFERDIHHCSSYDNCHVPWGTTHEKTWDTVKKNDHISGLFVWTGFDYLGEPTPFWWPSRSSYFGIIDLAGIPKDIYYMYQSEWTDKDVLHVFPHWNWKEGQEVDIWAYYNNADEIELFLNDKSLGRQSKKDGVYHVMWRVPFSAGTLKAVAYKEGKETLTKEVKTAGDPASIRLVADRNNIKADGKDISFVTVEVLDKDGYPVPTATNLIDFSIEGNGKLVGTDNGDPTDSNSLKKPSRNLFGGKAVVAVQAGRDKGKIKLIAKSSGLPDSELKIISK